MCDQFGSAWDGIYVLGKGHRCSIPLPSFQGRSSASSFHASPPWLKLLNMSDLLRCKLPVMVALPDSLSAWWFPFTPACPGQYTHSSFGGLSSMSDCFHLQCQDDCLHGWWSYLARQWSPTTTVFLMTEPSACSMGSCGYAIFSTEKLDLWLCFACSLHVF